MKRYSFGTQRPDRDSLGDWVRFDEVRRLTALCREILDDASPCASACSMMVDVELLERLEELLG